MLSPLHGTLCFHQHGSGKSSLLASRQRGDSLWTCRQGCKPPGHPAVPKMDTPSLSPMQDAVFVPNPTHRAEGSGLSGCEGKLGFSPGFCDPHTRFCARQPGSQAKQWGRVTGAPSRTSPLPATRSSSPPEVQSSPPGSLVSSTHIKGRKAAGNSRTEQQRTWTRSARARGAQPLKDERGRHAPGAGPCDRPRAEEALAQPRPPAHGQDSP